MGSMVKTRLELKWEEKSDLCSARFPPSLELVPLVTLDNAEMDWTDAFPDNLVSWVVYEELLQGKEVVITTAHCHAEGHYHL